MELLKKHRKTDETEAMEGGCSLMHSQGTESPSLMWRVAGYTIRGKVVASPKSGPW